MSKRISEAIKAAFKKTLPLNEEDQNVTAAAVTDNNVKATRKRKASVSLENDGNNDIQLPSPQEEPQDEPQPGPSRQVEKSAKIQMPKILQKEAGEDLFLEKTPLYENDHVKIFVVKDYLKRQKIFRLDDHLYSLKVELKDGHPPLLSSLLDVLRAAFEFMIKSLKSFYNETDRNIIYMTIYQNSMQSALNSGGFELQSNQSQNMVNYALNMLNRFLNSNATLKLDNSFCVYFKVLSVQHVNHVHHRRGPLMIVGCGDDVTTSSAASDSNSPGTLEMNISSEDDAEFLNKCLLTHVILGKLQFDARKTKNLSELALLLSLCKKHKKNYEKHYFTKKRRSAKSEASVTSARSKALKLLKQKVDELITACHLNQSGPYNVHEVLPKISEFLGIKVHLICGLQTKNASVLSFPPNFDDRKPQICLEKVSEHHVILISNLKTYFRHQKKRLCFECCKTFHQTYRHFCTKRTICFACRRFFCTKETEIHNDKYFEYCDGQIEENFLTDPIICPLCNLGSLTENCKIGHKNECGVTNTSKGRMGFYCNTCKKHFRYGFSNSEDAKNNHVCNVDLIRCYNCKFFKEENHQCPIKKQTATKEFPALAFFAFSFKALEQCHDCLNIRKRFKEENQLTWSQLYQHEKFPTLVCTSHELFQDKFVEPNVAVIFKEIKRGVFQQIIVTEDALKEEAAEDFNDSENLTFNYLPSNLKTSELNFSENYCHKGEGLIKRLQNLQGQANKTLVQNFLLLITQPQWQNTTFLSLNANNSSNLAVLRGFIDIDILPYVIENGNKVNLVSVDFLKLRFLNASAYLDGTIEEVRQQFNLEEDVYYFPTS